MRMLPFSASAALLVALFSSFGTAASLLLEAAFHAFVGVVRSPAAVHVVYVAGSPVLRSFEFTLLLVHCIVLAYLELCRLQR